MIKVEHLTKYYGDFLAVNDLSLKLMKAMYMVFWGRMELEKLSQ